MGFIDLAASPLAPGVSPVRIHYRDCGAGRPLIFLHSGWGYEIYPFDRQMPAFAARGRVVIPDRSGYGKSTPIDDLPPDFHARAADETRVLVAALGFERPVLWGHSDGGIIALLFALRWPELVDGVIAEATHFYRRKPRSRAFFESLIGEGPALGGAVSATLARDHGDAWPRIVERHSRAWRRIADEADSDGADFYGGRLAEIRAPALVIHGARDPRTEPGEIEALGRAVRTIILPAGGHSPHSDTATAADVTRIALAFIDDLRHEN